MRALITLLMVPLMFLNLFGAIVSGIWLAILGEWWAIGVGVSVALVWHFILGLFLMPGLLADIPAAFLVKRHRIILAVPFVLLSLSYTHAVVTAWCIAVFYHFVSTASPASFWPLLIWSYGVALTPWSFLAEKDQLGDPEAYSPITVFFAEMAYIIMGIVVVFDELPLKPLKLTMIFGGVMLVSVLFQTILATLTSWAKLSFEKSLSESRPDEFGVEE